MRDSNRHTEDGSDTGGLGRVDRRKFLTVAGAGATAALAGCAGNGDGGDGGDGGGRTLSAGDIGALALGFGFAGALLVPLFYAAHRMANDER